MHGSSPCGIGCVCIDRCCASKHDASRCTDLHPERLRRRRCRVERTQRPVHLTHEAAQFCALQAHSSIRLLPVFDYIIAARREPMQSSGWPLQGLTLTKRTRSCNPCNLPSSLVISLTCDLQLQMPLQGLASCSATAPAPPLCARTTASARCSAAT